MSRIGKQPITLPEKVEVKIEKNTVNVKGPNGEMSYTFSDQVSIAQEEGSITVSPVWESASAMWGTSRAVLNNMITGVSEGFKKSLEINGVGYKFEVQGQKLILSIGYSHKVEMDVPQELKVEMDAKAKNVIHITGIDKQKVGQFASKIKAKKKPEPYKGKGIKYLGEHIRRKAGKSGK